MSQDHSRLRELFIAACDLPEPQQDAYVEKHCSDPKLREELRQLLRSDADPSGAFADGNTTDGVTVQFDTVAETEFPEQIGQYRVKKILGEGGMGVVYLAEQQNPTRDVAIKVIRMGMASPELLKRFELEAEVLGRLTHPGIASIYEAGIFEDGSTAQHLPFLAMEYVEGISLRNYVKQSDLSTRDRLSLFNRICDAVHHAHQRGVIHRDLKPSNIVVKSDGQPTVLDFGVARVTGTGLENETLRTHAGQLLGTLQYMSPEQASGRGQEVDTRSDVYSLGVIAYELLTGKLPYEVGNHDYLKAARSISEESPTHLSSIDRKFRGDINTVVLKALEKRPEDRYSSALNFASDVQRFLDHEPIEAKRTGPVGRTWKWCQRNTVVATLLGLLALAISVGFVGMGIQTLKSMESERLAIESERLAKESERLAKESEQGTEHVLDVLVRSFRSPDATIAGRDVKMMDVLVKTVDDLESDATIKPLQKARLLHAIGKSFQSLGIYDQGVRVHRLALKIRTRELGEEHPDALVSLSNLGSLLYQNGEHAESMETFVRSLDLHTKVHGEEHPDTLKAMHNLAIGHRVRGNLEESIKLNEKSLTIMQRTVGPEDVDTLRTMNSLGLSYMLVHNYEKALPTIEEAYRRTTESLGERHPTTIYSMDLLAWVYGAVRPVRETIPLHVEVMARFADVLGEEHLKTHDAIMNAAVAYFENDDETETIRLLESVLPKFRKALGDGHESSIISATYLSEAYLVKDRPQEALTLLESIPEATAEKRVEGRRGLAEALVRTGRVEEGGELLQEVLKSERTEYADQAPELAEAIALAGERYLRGGMPAEAETLLREAHELLQANPMPRESLPLVVQSALGSALAEQGNYEEAETLLLAGVEGLRAERTERPYPLPREIEDAVRRTIRFYEQTDQEDETALWQKILAEQTASEAD